MGFSSIHAQEKSEGVKSRAVPYAEWKKIEERFSKNGIEKAKKDIAREKPRIFVFDVAGPAIIEAKKQVYLEKFGVKVEKINACIDERGGSYADAYNDTIYQYIKTKYGDDALKKASSEIGRLFQQLLKISTVTKK